MNKFEKQISAATQSLRDKQNAALRIPPPPRLSATKSGRPLIWWTGFAAALCVGYFLGIASPFHSPETPSPLAQLPKSEILRDTIFTTIRDTLFLEREVPVFIPMSKNKSLAVTHIDTDVKVPDSNSYAPLREKVETTQSSSGKNILDDTIHYALLVSM